MAFAGEYRRKMNVAGSRFFMHSIGPAVANEPEKGGDAESTRDNNVDRKMFNLLTRIAISQVKVK